MNAVSDYSSNSAVSNLSSQEVALLRQWLVQNKHNLKKSPDNNNDNDAQSYVSLDSEYPEYTESTHAWAVFADNPDKRATTMDRIVGTLIILAQLFTYGLFATEAIEDYQKGQVIVRTPHSNCVAYNEEPADNFYCEAEFTNHFDAFVAFFMLGIFLTGDVLRAGRVILSAPMGSTMFFACLAGIEVAAAFVAACISVSYNLYIGEVADAVEVGVGVLFIRELSQRAYAGIRHGKIKQYKSFFSVLVILIVLGMIMDPLCERLFAANEA